MRIRRKPLAGLLAIGVAGLVGASAASLGITSSSLGSDTTVVASCDPDGVTVTFQTIYDAPSSEFKVSGVVIGGLASTCSNKQVSVAVANGTLTLGAGSITAGTITGNAGNAAVTLSPSASARAINSVSVLISG